MPQIQAATPKQKGEQWLWYLGLAEKLPDQVLLAAHAPGHNGVGRDAGQVALLISVQWLPGVVPAEQLIPVPLSLVCQVLWGGKPRGARRL